MADKSVFTERLTVKELECSNKTLDSLFPRHRHRAAGDLVETVRAGQKRTFAGMLIAA